MLLKGKEYKFKATVAAVAEISEICPDGDLSRIGEILGGGFTPDLFKKIGHLVCALSKGYEEYEHPDVDEPEHLTMEQFTRFVDVRDIADIEDEAMAALSRDIKPTVEIEAKKNEAGKRAKG